MNISNRKYNNIVHPLHVESRFHRIILFILTKSHVLSWYVKHRNVSNPTPPSTWKKCLITSEHHLGDVLYRTASLDILKRSFPNCSFYYLCSKESLPILENNPNIEKGLPFLNSKRKFKVKNQFVKQLREMRFDAILVTDLYKNYLPLRLSIGLGIPNRVCFMHKGFHEWITYPINVEVFQPYPKYIRQYFSLLTNISVEGDFYPKVYLPSKTNDHLRLFMEKNSANGHAKIVAIFVGGRTQRVFYPFKSMVELIQLIKRNNSKTKIFIFGSKDEKGNMLLLNKINTEEVVYSFGELDVQELMLFLKSCSVVFTPDSGPRHLANAVRTPVIFYRHMMLTRINTCKYCPNEIDIFQDNELEHLSAKKFEQLLGNYEPSKIFALMKQYL